ncbi:MBL fold metallo-hydrolase [Nocardioides anomalus]|uniref:MBL fold metallo-hydrolase n=1 Tax=Nocardioides anomalus TaxID=2712223 RepID=A0A6G6WI19_9ACTN|nr:MBL fold metallo-hydrolase [Nocardioides anomalus]QIG44807.1 MBL fold metallo-hydrolase [Nocardioides anomalus]
MSLDVTWWGHASATVGRVAVDPLLTDRLFHLVRHTASPPAAAVDADLVLVSHLHHDHCHLPSLARFGDAVPIVVPRGGERYVAGLGRDRVVPVGPGDVVERAGVRVEVLAASHDGRRHPLARDAPPALGFRVSAAGGTWWYPGDTELRGDMHDVDPVDLALVPVGGWGPTLGDGHMDPTQAAEAVARVGASWAVPVHWGTFWPVGLQRVARANHHRLFTTPGSRFATALEGSGTEAVVAVPGERVER